MDTRKVASEYRLSYWTRLFQERNASGESIDEFCQGKGLSRNKYYYWQRKLREKACATLDEVQLSQTGMTVQKFMEVSVSESSHPALSLSSNTLSIQIGEFQLIAGDDYPTEKLSAVLRGLLSLC